MNKSTLIKYLLFNKDDTESINDIYFNNVELLLRLDATVNSLGFPFYKDYSSRQRQIRYFKGTSSQSEISFIDRNTLNYPVDTNIDTINNFVYIPNKYNHTKRTAELNIKEFYTDTKSSYFEVMLNGQQPISFGSDDFTIEISFFADEVALPWKYQTLFSFSNIFAVSNNLTLENLDTYIVNHGNGYGLYLANDTLKFYDGNAEYLIASNIEKLTWYHIAIQRNNNKLEMFVNFNKINSYSNYNRVFNYTNNLNQNTIDKRISIGASNYYESLVVSPLGFNYFNGLTTKNHVDMSFSGGLSNFRITKGIARYKQSFYNSSLPFYITDIDNKIDDYYSETILNLPFTFDLFDYSQYKSHFLNREQLKKTLPLTTGYLNLDGKNKYETKNIPVNLNTEEWTLEFYYTLFFNSEPYLGTTSGSSQIQAISKTDRKTLTAYEALLDLVPGNANPQIDNRINIVALKSNNKKVLNIDIRWLTESYFFNVFEASYINSGNYISLKASTDGTNWLTTSTARRWTPDSQNRTPINIPADDLILFEHSLLNNNTLKIQSAYEEPNTHVAIERFNNFIYVFINGTLVNTLPFPYTLYFENNNLQAVISDYFFDNIELYNSTLGKYILSLAIKGLRITNKARYSTSVTNEYFAYHNTFNLALNSGVFSPPRFKIINILKNINLPSVSSNTVSWSVYLSQAVDLLELEDFTLTQLQGVENANLISITKNNDYIYTVTASTGNNNGLLGLNFIDKRTLKYKDKNKYVSEYVGELSFEGEMYVINKSAPIPLLTSGSSPYINSAFTVNIKFDSSISIYDFERIGIVNGTITNNLVLNQDTHEYQITVTPVAQEPTIVQALEGTGITDTNIISQKSNTLTRIYSSYFPILQCPLNNIYTFNDLSPSRLTLTETVINNTLFNTNIAPFGESSSLEVNPNLEQSGLNFSNFNAIGSTNDSINQNWTLEFFLRIDSSSNKTSHIFSIEDQATGICILAQNKKLVIQRSITNSTPLFTNLNIADIDTNQFIDWSDTSKTKQEKYPHFAITKQDNTYRFYRNGVRIQLIQSNINIDVTKGNIIIGYYKNRVTDINYFLSNLKLTLGKALYTSAFVDIPGLPYTILPNIADITELISYISIYSNNAKANVAREGNIITLKFTSIVNLINLPVVTIGTKLADVVYINNFTYSATVLVDNTFNEGSVLFKISILNEPNLPDKEFTKTTNNSSVIVKTQPLTANIYTFDENNSNYIINIDIDFNQETLTPLTLDLLTTNNCIVSNLFKYSNQNKYTLTLIGLSTGNVSLKLEENKLKDISGIFNIESNTFTRDVVVPAYIPDTYWDNVIFLLQPENNIFDESLSQTEITVNNVSLTSSNSPTGLSKSLYFNGKNSSLNFTLSESLPSTIDYTIEFFIFIQKSSVIKLAKPTILPATNVHSTDFVANWNPVENATAYKLDVSNASTFNTYLPGYKSLLLDNINTFKVGDLNSNNVPIIANNYFVSSRGFTNKIKYDNKANIGFYLNVSLDNNFTKKLYCYNDNFIQSKYTEIENIANLVHIDNNNSVINSNNTLENSNNTNSNLVTGLLTQENYPRLLYILEEDNIRLYNKEGYVLPGIIDEVNVSMWSHIALVNTNNKCYLYRDGEFTDSVKNVAWTNTNTTIGFLLGHINALITGIRITKGIARYTSNFQIPLLPYSKN